MRLLFTLLTIFRVAFVGDPQVDNEKELEYARKSIYAELRSRNDIDLVVVLGDLVNEKPGLIAPSEASLDSLPCPWVRVNGNHDGPDPIKDSTFTAGGIRFILMNNVRKVRRGGYEGGFNEKQKHWLDSIVTSSPATEKLVCCTHIPVSQSHGMDSLSNILASHRDVLLVSGHTHMVDRHIVERGTEEIVAGATCGTWWRGVKDENGIPYALMNCGAPRGYFTADFKPSSRKWYSLDYKCVGRPAEERMSLNMKDGKLIINVYGGSREGELKLKLDKGGWKEARHWYGTAVEAQEIIDMNKAMSREYRREHRDEFLPFRNIPSPHLWVIDAPELKSTESVRVRYSDGAMRIRQ